MIPKDNSFRLYLNAGLFFGVLLVYILNFIGSEFSMRLPVANIFLPKYADFPFRTWRLYSGIDRTFAVKNVTLSIANAPADLSRSFNSFVYSDSHYPRGFIHFKLHGYGHELPQATLLLRRLVDSFCMSQAENLRHFCAAPEIGLSYKCFSINDELNQLSSANCGEQKYVLETNESFNPTSEKQP